MVSVIDCWNRSSSDAMDSGRLIVPVGASWAGQELMAYDKDSNGRVTSKSFSAVRYVPLTSREGQLNL